MGKDFINGAYEVIYKHPKWKEEANEYEERLAAKLFHMSYTKNAVKTALGKISRILTDYYKEDGAKELSAQKKETVEAAAGMTNLAQNLGEQDAKIPVNEILVNALMQERRDNSSAGQVNKVMAGDKKENGEEYTQDEAAQANMETLDAVMNKDGNLREQMTLLYNGMFINGGRSSEQIKSGTSFKGVLMNINRQKATESKSKVLKGINFDLLEGLDQYKKGEDVFDTFNLAWDLERRSEKLQGKGTAVSRWYRSMKRAWSSVVYNAFHRKGRKQPLKAGEAGLGLEHYEKLGVGLSDREKAFAYTTSENETDGKKRLRWKEGEAWSKMKKDLTANGMLQRTGPSGTTLRMLGAYRLMGASEKELLDFRLALIAWMVTSHDHSLYEILQGSHNAGVKGTESLEEPAVMYTNIDPLDTQMLRDHFAKDKQFPHEIIFKKQLDEVKEEREEYEKHTGRSVPRAERQKEFDDLDQEVKTIVEVEAEQSKVKQKLKQEKGKWEKIIAGAKKAKANGKKSTANLDEANAKIERINDILEAYDEAKKLQDEKKKELNTKKSAIRLLPDMALFTKTRNVIKGTNAEAFKAQDLALNMYTTGAYMTMNVGMKWGGWLGKMKLTDDRVDMENFGSYQSSYKGETKNSKLMDKIYVLIRAAARLSQDALAERGSYEASTENAEPDYMHAAVVNTFRGEKSSGDFYQKEGAQFDTKALTSTSKNIAKALEYFNKSVDKNGYDKSVVVLFQLTGKGAVDITELSKVSKEEEVLVPAGTTFKVETKLVKNVSVEKLKSAPEDLVEDPVSEEELAQEHVRDENGRIDFEKIKHVNVVKLLEVDGPGARKRKKANDARERREELMRSLAQ